MNILEFIPIGHENGYTLEQISMMCGEEKRVVRHLISKARRDVVIINLQDGHGYFLPKAGEEDLVERWLSQELSRLKNHALSLRGAREFVKNGE